MYIDKTEQGYLIRYGEWGTGLKYFENKQEAIRFYKKNKDNNDPEIPNIYGE